MNLKKEVRLQGLTLEEITEEINTVIGPEIYKEVEKALPEDVVFEEKVDEIDYIGGFATLHLDIVTPFVIKSPSEMTTSLVSIAIVGERISPVNYKVFGLTLYGGQFEIGDTRTYLVDTRETTMEAFEKPVKMTIDHILEMYNNVIDYVKKEAKIRDRQ